MTAARHSRRSRPEPNSESTTRTPRMTSAGAKMVGERRRRSRQSPYGGTVVTPSGGCPGIGRGLRRRQTSPQQSLAGNASSPRFVPTVSIDLRPRPPGCGHALSPNQKTADCGGFSMELAGLEPATSWVRSRRSLGRNPASLAPFRAYASVPPTPSPTLCSPFSSRTTLARYGRARTVGTPAGVPGRQREMRRFQALCPIAQAPCSADPAQVREMATRVARHEQLFEHF